MNILVCDIETFYSKAFSLSKLTTEAYIRSPEFEVIGVSVKENDAPAVWFSGTKEETKRFLGRYDWDNSIAVAHNAMFDMAILNWHFGFKPKRIADTLSMARAVHGSNGSVSLANLVKQYKLGEKGDEVINALGMKRLDFDAGGLRRYGAYCCNDTELTYKLFRVLVGGFPVEELRLIDLTIRMFSEPVLELFEAGLNDHLHDVRQQKSHLLQSINAGKETLMSNPKFAVALEALGVVPPRKISKATGKETWAFGKTDEEFVALLEHDDVGVQTLVAARLGVKSTLEETRTERLIEIARRGAFPIPLRYYAAHTGRWGGDDKVNLQNLPRGGYLKHTILPPAGYVFCDSDSSQIEARTLAWLAEQDDLVGAFERGEDVYKIMASHIYGVPVNLITPAQRFLGKTVVLGCGYGLGWTRFQAHMKNQKVLLTDSEAKDVIGTYRDAAFKIPELWEQGDKAIMAMVNDETAPYGRDGAVVVEGKKGIRLPNGLYLQYPNLRREQNEEGKREYVYDTKRGKSVVATKLYGGKLTENCCQALARIVIGEQMLKINKKYKVVMTVHDAVGCLIPTNEEETGKEYVEMCMRIRPNWAPDLPLNCEAGTGLTYGDC